MPEVSGHEMRRTVVFTTSGDDGNRTHDLLLAKQALYQLSYVPLSWCKGYRPVIRLGEKSKRCHGVDDPQL